MPRCKHLKKKYKYNINISLDKTFLVLIVDSCYFPLDDCNNHSLSGFVKNQRSQSMIVSTSIGALQFLQVTCTCSTIVAYPLTYGQPATAKIQQSTIRNIMMICILCGFSQLNLLAIWLKDDSPGSPTGSAILMESRVLMQQKVQQQWQFGSNNASYKHMIHIQQTL